MEIEEAGAPRVPVSAVRRPRWRRALGIAGRLLAGLGVLLAIALAVVAVQGWRAFGMRATGERRARMERSPQWQASSGRFVNPQPLVNDVIGSITGWLDASRYASPDGALVVEHIDPRRFDTPPPSGLRVTWMGHASMLIEIDGVRVLTDPMWSERAGPLGWIGPRRWYPPPIALAELPPVDVVLISHDHYDHLDCGTITAIRDLPGWDKTTFIVPLGVGADLAYWGIQERRILERDWWDRTTVISGVGADAHAIEVVTTPARHASGRTLWGMDVNLWAGYALLGARHRVYFSGDTGFFPAMKRIGEELGPFDVTMIESGQYHAAWPDWHIGPERAVAAHQLVRGRVMLPVHWALLTLAFHGWTEPIERVLAAAKLAGVTVLTPRPGQSVEPELGAPEPPERPQRRDRWWPAVPWQTAVEAPLVSTGVE